jgi:hypothetical protein
LHGFSRRACGFHLIRCPASNPLLVIKQYKDLVVKCPLLSRAHFTESIWSGTRLTTLEYVFQFSPPAELLHLKRTLKLHKPLPFIPSTVVIELAAPPQQLPSPAMSCAAGSWYLELREWGLHGKVTKGRRKATPCATGCRFPLFGATWARTARQGHHSPRGDRNALPPLSSGAATCQGQQIWLQKFSFRVHNLSRIKL